MTTYYTPSGNPPTAGRGLSKQMRDEFALLQTGLASVDTLLAPKASPTFTGTVVLPSTTSVGNVSATELAYLDGVTSALQTQIDARAAHAGQTYTGTHAFPTQSAGDASTKAATTAFVGAAIATVNAQTALSVMVVSATSVTMVAGAHYILTNVAATTATLPASPASGDQIWVTWTNTLLTNSIARNGNTIMGLSENMTLNAVTNGTVQLRYVNSSWRLV